MIWYTITFYDIVFRTLGRARLRAKSSLANTIAAALKLCEIKSDVSKIEIEKEER